MPPRLDLDGQRFSRLLVLGYAGNDSRGKSTWQCQCDCGTVLVVSGTHLVSGHTQSCGCLHHDTVLQINTTHGMTGTRLHRIWHLMKQRCSNENTKSYHNYGGRGITVCKEWEDFETFSQWAMSNGYSDELTLDRINNDGNYCPDNCRWITRREQSNNTRKNRYLEYNGERKTISEWARIFGVKPSLISDRIKVLGWTVEDALEIPRGGRGHATSRVSDDY